MPASEAQLDETSARYAELGVARWWLHQGPHAQPAALESWLTARGFTRPARRTWAKMLLSPGTPRSRARFSYDARPATGAEYEGLAALICEAYPMPRVFVPWFAALGRRSRWRGFVACEGDTVVGGGFVFADNDTRSAWLGLGAVRKERRGHGTHRALMRARIDWALDQGLANIVTETGEPIGDEPNPSLHNMVGCGFRQVASRANWEASRPAG